MTYIILANKQYNKLTNSIFSHDFNKTNRAVLLGYSIQRLWLGQMPQRVAPACRQGKAATAWQQWLWRLCGCEDGDDDAAATTVAIVQTWQRQERRWRGQMPQRAAQLVAKAQLARRAAGCLACPARLCRTDERHCMTGPVSWPCVVARRRRAGLPRHRGRLQAFF